MLTLTDVRIPKRGKGQKGKIETCQIIGKPITDDDGITRDIDYSGIQETDSAEILNFVSDNLPAGITPSEVIARGFNAIMKSASIRAQLQITELRKMVVKAGIADAQTAEKMADNVLAMQETGVFTIEEAIKFIAERQKSKG